MYFLYKYQRYVVWRVWKGEGGRKICHEQFGFSRMGLIIGRPKGDKNSYSMTSMRSSSKKRSQLIFICLCFRLQIPSIYCFQFLPQGYYEGCSLPGMLTKLPLSAGRVTYAQGKEPSVTVPSFFGNWLNFNIFQYHLAASMSLFPCDSFSPPRFSR